MQNEEFVLNLIRGYKNKDEILATLRSLSPEDEIQALANLIGYKQIPPTIEEFVKDPYYLGDIFGSTLYPIWMERLKIIYPDPIRTSATFVSVSGCLGSGKSTFASIMLMYDYLKFSMIEDPYKFLQLAINTPFTFRAFNVNLDKASEVFIGPINKFFSVSPYFRELHRRLGSTAFGAKFLPASNPRHTLSEAVISAVVSEVNFYRPGVAEGIIDKLTGRLDSRMQLGFGYLNHIILDSSSTREDSALTDFIRNSPYSSQLICFNTSIWEAKAHLGLYFNHGSFRVYAGDSETAPFILDDEHPIDESSLDKDRIIVCPNEVRDAFEKNISMALNDKCGISLASTDNFIIDKDTVKSRFDLPMVTPEEIVVDFYDKESIWSIVGESILEVLPIDRRLYVRIDLGITHDKAGFSICYFDGMRFEGADKDHPVSTFKIPVAFDIGRNKGQETPVNKLRDFILELSSYREIALFTTDQYQSTQLRQELRQAKLNTAMTSVDRTDLPYITWKMLLMDNRCHVCENLRLRTEVLDLKRVGNKIDHTAAGINMKDTADACCGALFSAYQNPKEAAVPSKFKHAEVLLNVTNNLRIARKDRDVGKLNNRNFW